MEIVDLSLLCAEYINLPSTHIGWELSKMFWRSYVSLTRKPPLALKYCMRSFMSFGFQGSFWLEFLAIPFGLPKLGWSTRGLSAEPLNCPKGEGNTSGLLNLGWKGRGPGPPLWYREGIGLPIWGWSRRGLFPKPSLKCPEGEGNLSGLLNLGWNCRGPSPLSGLLNLGWKCRGPNPLPKYRGGGNISGWWKFPGGSNHSAVICRL